MKTNTIKWNESMNYICSSSSNIKKDTHIVSNITKKKQDKKSCEEIKKEQEQEKEKEMKTIIANVIYGSSTHKCQTTVFISFKNDIEPTQVLGCFITNEKIHKNTLLGCSSKKINVKFDGELEIHIWYTTDGTSNILKKNIHFSEVISLEKDEDLKEIKHKSIASWINKTPSSIKTMIVNKSDTPMISIQIEYELGVKVIGESLINVLSYKIEDKGSETNLHST